MATPPVTNAAPDEGSAALRLGGCTRRTGSVVCEGGADGRPAGALAEALKSPWKRRGAPPRVSVARLRRRRCAEPPHRAGSQRAIILSHVRESVVRVARDVAGRRRGRIPAARGRRWARFHRMARLHPGLAGSGRGGAFVAVGRSVWSCRCGDRSLRRATALQRGERRADRPGAVTLGSAAFMRRRLTNFRGCRFHPVSRRKRALPGWRPRGRPPHIPPPPLILRLRIFLHRDVIVPPRLEPASRDRCASLCGRRARREPQPARRLSARDGGVPGGSARQSPPYPSSKSRREA